MENKSDKKEFSIELTNASDLMERQSVRATFRLSSIFIEALSALSTQLGIKQKSLFDHLMEDTASLLTIARQVQPEASNKKDRVQKTFVMSKKSLSSLDLVSKTFTASRDDLVEYSIQRLLPILVEERQKQKKREKALDKITDHFDQAAELLKDIIEDLGKEDPIYKALHSIFTAYEDAIDNIEDMVDTGKRIKELPVDKFQI